MPRRKNEDLEDFESADEYADKIMEEVYGEDKDEYWDEEDSDNTLF